MELRHLHCAIITIFLVSFQYVYSGCPLIYQMIDKYHSYCAKKISLSSLPPTLTEIEFILKVHNQERFDVNAQQMQKMYWNVDLAEIAQRYADHCYFDHDKSIQRQTPRIPLSTGQNLAMGYKTWTLAIQGWANEKNDFVYGSDVQHGDVGHYTQMVKDTAALIGCGLAICPKGKLDPHNDWPHYVCNYVTGQLGDNKPYIPASSSESNNERLYDCQGLVCLYNGIIDLNSCQCQCESHTSGKQCEILDCSLLSNDCKYGNDKSLCTKYSNVPNECPKFCGLCSRYDEMKKYYNSLEILSNIGIQMIKSTQSILLFRNISFHIVFIQLIIVHFVLSVD
ncbi:unnamed protein product [Rotaria sordida]|uniref:SCP domain-containing protein n=1 Tax=Rotaria sordida TaxID=392033 RepID=A0A814Y7H3_9BILA|nr:unnamed protein product [Rotaria sordida]CAF1505901.1 unnamed protein product [Rotaria sordida]